MEDTVRTVLGLLFAVTVVLGTAAMAVDAYAEAAAWYALTACLMLTWDRVDR